MTKKYVIHINDDTFLTEELFNFAETKKLSEAKMFDDIESVKEYMKKVPEVYVRTPSKEKVTLFVGEYNVEFNRVINFN